MSNKYLIKIILYINLLLALFIAGYTNNIFYGLLSLFAMPGLFIVLTYILEPVELFIKKIGDKI